MKVVFYLPAHPSYFEDLNCTQAQIETALTHLDLLHSGELLKGKDMQSYRMEFVLLREPGNNPRVEIDIAGPNEEIWKSEIVRFRRIMDKELESRISFLRAQLAEVREGFN